jgi:hypothetical protein
MIMAYSLETFQRIYNDQHGDYIQIGPDADALGLVEIRSYTRDGKLETSMVFAPEQITLLCQALAKAASELEKD